MGDCSWVVKGRAENCWRARNGQPCAVFIMPQIISHTKSPKPALVDVYTWFAWEEHLHASYPRQLVNRFYRFTPHPHAFHAHH
jgi:hypothetical protein